MATNYSATTEAIKEPANLLAERLRERDLPKAWINMAVYKSLPSLQQSLICPRIRMRSRSAWAMHVLGILCVKAKREDLLFLCGIQKPSSVRVFSILTEDEDSPTGRTYVGSHGAILEEEALLKATMDIQDLFEWSGSNLDLLASRDLMGHFASREGIVDALSNTIIFQTLVRSDCGELELEVPRK